ncbi:MAG TPA: HAD family phosphatase [Pseudomonadales bacterium]|nr:HAD family phosphatase [Pseudomonadales bacterium]
MSRPVDVVLFDFGGVFTASPFGAVEGMARDLGIAVEPFAEAMFGAYHLDTDHPWHRLERGEISFDQAREDIIALGRESGLSVDPLDLLVRMAGSNLVHDNMVQALRDIKAAGYPTAIITNNVKEFRDGWRALIPVDELIDRVFDSSELGIRKPDPAIYRHALDKMGGIDPHRAVFLDDVPQNVQSAKDLGVRGIQVTDDPAQAIRELRALLNLPA